MQLFRKKNTTKPKNSSKRKRHGVFFKVGIAKEREYFVENLSMMLSSGMVISQIIESLKKDKQSKRMRMVLSDMQEDIEEGLPLWKVFSRTGLFSQHAVSLLRIGEQSGKLAENVEVIRKQEQKSRAFQSRVRSATLYPAVVLVVMLVVGIGIAWFILPNLARMFENMKIPLPFITKALIAFGEFISAHGTVVVPGLVVFLLILFYILFVFERTKFIGQAILLLLPGLKRLVREVELARLGYMLGSLLEAGVPIVVSLDALKRASTVKRYRQLYGELKENIEAGESFRQSFANIQKMEVLVPLSIQNMIVAGEQTGRLSHIFYRIGKTFELKTEDTTKNLSVLLEPILLFVVWVGVVLVALAVILPIYSLIGGLRESSAPPPASVEKISQVNVLENSPREDLGLLSKQIPPSLRILETPDGLLNVRSQSSREGDIIGQVETGSEYDYIEIQNGWYKISFGGEEDGWVFGEYVEVVNDEGDQGQEERNGAPAQVPVSNEPVPEEIEKLDI